MKYLVVSDNHGNRDVLVDIVHRWEDKVDAMFHCGDSELKVDDTLWQKFVVVKGNCDYSSDYHNETTLLIGLDQVYMTHGHLFNVNMGLTYLSLAAKENHANLAFYGHTHKLAAELVEGVLYLNPGSISQPRGTYSHLKTYALVETLDERIEVCYYNEKHELVPELTFTFQK